MGSFTGIYTGVVEDTADELNKKRVRVRVFGVFEEPIAVEHLPWASPVFSDCRLPQVGDIVYVMFRAGQWENPVYLCKNDFELDLDKKDRDEKINAALSAVKEATNGIQISASGIDVQMSECVEGGLEDFPPNQDNTICDKDMVFQTTGEGKTFLKLSDIIFRVDVDKLMAVLATLLVKIVDLGIEGSNSIVVKGVSIGIEGSTSVKIVVGGSIIDVSSSGIEVTGTNIKLNGTTVLRGVTPTTPGFCSLPNCLFTGVPHNISSAGH